ncbi:C-type lectin 37Db-like [Calliphora vicina]|uniref:C-type lectin 37Db-like n=1 Tax=Calliphora vicina TaxID=7373 RepID=UPI00325A4612
MITTTKPVLLALSVVLWALIFALEVEGDLITDIGNKKYLIKTDKKLNWYQANHACTVAGMSLASIESETEQTNLKNYLFKQNHLNDGFWLSGNNLADATVYTWLSSGNKLDYTNWASSQPSPTPDYCVYTDANLKWTTEACGGTTPVTKYFICSRPHVPDCGITGRCKVNRNFFF